MAVITMLYKWFRLVSLGLHDRDVCQDEYIVLDAISHVNQQLTASVAEDQALRFIMIRICIIIPQLSICV